MPLRRRNYLPPPYFGQHLEEPIRAEIGTNISFLVTCAAVVGSVPFCLTVYIIFSCDTKLNRRHAHDNAYYHFPRFLTGQLLTVKRKFHRVSRKNEALETTVSTLEGEVSKLRATAEQEIVEIGEESYSKVDRLHALSGVYGSGDA